MTVRSIFLTAALLAFAVEASGSGPVTLSQDDQSFTLDNGTIAARIEKRTGDLVSMKYQGLDLVRRGKGYWSFVGSGSRLGTQRSAQVRQDPATNGGERAEVACRFSFDAATGGVPCNVQLCYSLGRDESGLQVFAIFDHPAGNPPFSFGESRYALKLNPEVFDTMTIDAQRNRQMPTGEDWDRGTPLNLKEARRLTTGRDAGRAEHKYDYSAMLSEVPAYGWSSTSKRVGLWLINPSMEYIGGGATKVELTGHLDVNSGGAPTLLNMWVGSHYGGTSLSVRQGEAWTKIVGPFVLYANHEGDSNALWNEALARARHEADQWPYAWMKEPSYPPSAQRGQVAGQLSVKDPFDSEAKVTGWRVGLTAPDYQANRRIGTETVDWQRDAKYYQFWTRADKDGSFTIRNVRPGTYSLHAFGDGVPGEYSKAQVTVDAGGVVDLGKLEWVPERFGKTLWQIGVPDRSAAEFRHGDHYWQWGLYLMYATEFPNDVDFIVGQSDWHRDWNYVQPPRLNPEGRVERASTWRITFEVPAELKGTATLRLGIAGSRTERGINVTLNDQSIGGTGLLPDTGVMHRDGIRGYWVERRVAFDAGRLKQGRNVLALTVPATSWVQGVLYDYLRLEVSP